mmetsp:Transcript_24074/g.77287  ORF Transcript_24074/g.77287 Transcript_24074/m.77287 type:complete len:214 (-) Transcript_24074:1477-2118(-)
MLGPPSPLRSPPHPHLPAGRVVAQAAAEVRVCAFGPWGAAVLLRHQRCATRPAALRRARHLRVAAARCDGARHEPRDGICERAAAVPAAAAWPPEGRSPVGPPALGIDAALASVERGRLVDGPTLSPSRGAAEPRATGGCPSHRLRPSLCLNFEEIRPAEGPRESAASSASSHRGERGSDPSDAPCAAFASTCLRLRDSNTTRACTATPAPMT